MLSSKTQQLKREMQKSTNQKGNAEVKEKLMQSLPKKSNTRWNGWLFFMEKWPIMQISPISKSDITARLELINNKKTFTVHLEKTFKSNEIQMDIIIKEHLNEERGEIPLVPIK